MQKLKNNYTDVELISIIEKVNAVQHSGLVDSSVGT